jgi:hypothetical protein
VQSFLEGKRGRRRDGSTVPKADDTTKSGVTIGVWRSKITKENWIGGPNAWLGR